MVRADFIGVTMGRSRADAIDSATRLTRTFGDMAVWKWNDTTWTLATVAVSPKDGEGYTVIPGKKEK